MSELGSTVILGIGSSHGDDRIGWNVIDQLMQRQLDGVACKKLVSPVEILDFLTADAVHVADAAALNRSESNVLRLIYGDEEDRNRLATITPTGTHEFGVTDTLRLARSLARRTDHITLWLGRGESFGAMAPPSQAALRSIEDCVKAIIQEVRDARRVAG